MKKKLIALSALVLCCVFVFSGCAQIEKLFNVNSPSMKFREENGEMVLYSYSDKTNITEVTVPDEVDGKPVTKIADFGLCNAESLLSITIGKNVREIGSWALTNNQHLKEYVVDPANTAFKAEDGVLFTADGKTLVAYPCGRNVEFDRFGNVTTDEEGNALIATYAIPDGVETIASKAFYKCYYVDVTAFPSTIRVIGEKAFHKCSALKNFTVPAALEVIGKDAFAYDEGLTTLEIGENIKEIGEYAFFYCKNLKSIVIHAAEEELTLGKKWQPTDKGKILTDCEIAFDE